MECARLGEGVLVEMLGFNRQDAVDLLEDDFTADQRCPESAAVAPEGTCATRFPAATSEATANHRRRKEKAERGEFGYMMLRSLNGRE